MKPAYVIACAVLAACVVALWLTKSELDTGGPVPQPAEPWKNPEARHLAEDGIKIGPNAGDDIRVTREGEKIRVELSAEFLKAKGETFLSVVGMMRPSELMSEDRYAEFLDEVHATISEHHHEEHKE
jgi:hypothetical protein